MENDELVEKDFESDSEADLEDRKKVPKKKKSKIKSFIWNFVFYIVIVGGIIFGLPKILVWALDTQYPMAAITSGSMWPVLKTGDMVFIKGVTVLEQIEQGDIIVFQSDSNGTLTIHRIVSIKEGIITTKGDANFTEDTPISFDKVVGKTLNWKGDKPVRLPYLGSVTNLSTRLRNK
ncbi:MAG: signal peptidase I [Patescibacteria group bacterium]